MSELQRVVSFGGGVQSTALLVLAAQGRIDYRTFIMANVGDDSEHPATLEFVRSVAMPYAADNGLALHLLDRIRRDGRNETLYGRMMREGSKSIPIPLYQSGGKPFGRSCTADFKIRVTGKWLKANGATKDNPATVALGISVDEIQRANPNKANPYERLVFPLLDLGMRRSDCMAVIRDAGLPVPVKSACFFCPFHRPEVWDEQRRTEPELFEKACRLEETINERRKQSGREALYLTRFGKPLRQVATKDQLTLDGGEGQCDNGWCMA